STPDEETAIESRLRSSRPVDAGLHVAPPSEDTKAPSGVVPAYTVEEDAESTATAVTSSVSMPLLAGCQVWAPSVVLKTPWVPVPAYTVRWLDGSMESVLAAPPVSPLLASRHVTPASVDLYTAEWAPAMYSTDGSTGSTTTWPLSAKPVGDHVSPPSVLLYRAALKA